jgi:hypothetical protein
MTALEKIIVFKHELRSQNEKWQKQTGGFAGPPVCLIHGHGIGVFGGRIGDAASQAL